MRHADARTTEYPTERLQNVTQAGHGTGDFKCNIIKLFMDALGGSKIAARLFSLDMCSPLS